MQEKVISRYKTLDFYARQVVEGFITGRHKSPFHGFSVEFSDYRQYNTGESTKNIDWHLYGRTDKLFVKQFEEETNLRCQIVIDHSSSMLFPIEKQGNIDDPNKNTFAIYAAAVLIELLHRQRDAFGLTLFSNGIENSTPCRSNTLHQHYLLEELDTLLLPVQLDEKERRTTSIADALHLTAEALHKRSLVIIFTDAMILDKEQEPLFDALRHLRHNKHEVILFHTYDLAQEVNLEYDDRPHRFIDLETGNEFRLIPNEIASNYRKNMEQLFSNIQQRAMQYRIDYVPVDIKQGFNSVMLPFLLKRSKL